MSFSVFRLWLRQGNDEREKSVVSELGKKHHQKSKIQKKWVQRHWIDRRKTKEENRKLLRDFFLFLSSRLSSAKVRHVSFSNRTRKNNLQTHVWESIISRLNELEKNTSCEAKLIKQLDDKTSIKFHFVVNFLFALWTFTSYVRLKIFFKFAVFFTFSFHFFFLPGTLLR